MNKFSLPNFDIQKNIGYIAIGFAMVLILLVDFTLIMRPQLGVLASAGRKASELSADIKKTRYNVKNISSLEAEAKQLQGKLNGVIEKLGEHREAIMVAEHISKLAEKYNVQVNQAMPLKEQDVDLSDSDKGEFLAVPILVNAEGGYHNFGLFFNALETDQVFLDIQSFEITGNPQSSKKHFLTMTIMSFVPKKVLE